MRVPAPGVDCTAAAAAAAVPQRALSPEGDIIIRPSAAADRSLGLVALALLCRRNLEPEPALEVGVTVFGVVACMLILPAAAAHSSQPLTVDLVAGLGVLELVESTRHSVEKPRAGRVVDGDAATAAAAVEGITTPRLRWFSTGVPLSTVGDAATGLATAGPGLGAPSDAIGATSSAGAQAMVRLDDPRCKAAFFFSKAEPGLPSMLPPGIPGETVRMFELGLPPLSF